MCGRDLVRVGSLFSGIGGFDLGLERAGFTIAWQVENDLFCRRVLKKHWPHTPCGTDVREWTGNGHEPVDLLVGGFPCQDLSVAGKRKGLAGERSGLFWEIVRIAKEIKPTWGLFENVPGLFSSHGGRDMATVLEGLRHCWPVVGYRVLDSRYFGVAQRRRRVFFVCGPTESGVEHILFEPEGGAGDSPAGREEGTHVARSLASSSGSTGYRYDPNGEEYVTALRHMGGGGPDDNEAQGGHLIAAPLTSTYAKGADRGGNDRGSLPEGHLVTHCLRADGFDASEDGMGRGTPMVPILEVGGGTSSRGAGPNGCGIGQEGDPMFTLQAGKQHAVGVRRLTPIECARLQGFPAIEKSVIIETCSDLQKSRVFADGPNLKSPKVAVNVKNGVSVDGASSAERHSQQNDLNDNRPVQSFVHINYGLGEVEIRSHEKLLYVANSADERSSSRLHMSIADFVRLLAGITSIADQIIEDGAEVSRLSERCLTRRQNGKRLVVLYGNETMRLVNDVFDGSITPSKLTKSIISRRLSIENIGLSFATSFYSVVAAISGFIPNKTLPADSFSLELTFQRSWTCLCDTVPCICPDGPQYRAYGNAVTVNVIEWLGRRLLEVLRRQKGQG